MPLDKTYYNELNELLPLERKIPIREWAEKEKRRLLSQDVMYQLLDYSTDRGLDWNEEQIRNRILDEIEGYEAGAFRQLSNTTQFLSESLMIRHKLSDNALFRTNIEPPPVDLIGKVVREIKKEMDAQLEMANWRRQIQAAQFTQSPFYNTPAGEKRIRYGEKESLSRLDELNTFKQENNKLRLTIPSAEASDTEYAKIKFTI